MLIQRQSALTLDLKRATRNIMAGITKMPATLHSRIKYIFRILIRSVCVNMRNFLGSSLKTAICAACFILGNLQVLYANDSSNVEQMLQNGQYEAVAAIWKDQADSGNTEAMRNLAKLHYAGSIKNPDPKFALSLLLEALKLGDLGV